jgi:CheY-like chemotaxis protein
MSHKLLLADDSVTIQRVIELTFADEDVQVVVVGDGRQAIERVRAERPDIVLADVGMPERDGYEVAAFIKNDPELAQIPVLLLTGAFEPLDEGRARAAGCESPGASVSASCKWPPGAGSLVHPRSATANTPSASCNFDFKSNIMISSPFSQAARPTNERAIYDVGAVVDARRRPRPGTPAQRNDEAIATRLAATAIGDNCLNPRSRSDQDASPGSEIDAEPELPARIERVGAFVAVELVLQGAADEEEYRVTDAILQ